MDWSIFLAKVLGLYLVVFGIAMLLHAKRIKAIINDIDSNPTLLLFSGIIPLILGALLVAGHEVWEANWRMVITLIGWLAFIKGAIRVTAPQVAIRVDKKFIKQPINLKICAIVVLLLGIFLCYVGFIG